MAPSARPYRRRKEPLVDPKQLGYTVKGRSKSTWEQIADNEQVSPSELFDLMVEHIPLDAYGRPTWLPPRPPQDGVLPIDTA
jgi:hypothetical protein